MCQLCVPGSVSLVSPSAAFHCPSFTEMVNTVASILKLGASINLYMFHGGTNFGFMNGALEADEYKSDVTSYGEFSFVALPVPLL